MEEEIIKRYSRYRNILEPPNLIEIQLDSYQEMKDSGIQQIITDISPITSNNGRYQIFLPDRSPVAKMHQLVWEMDPPEYSIQECIEKGLTYSCSLSADVLIRDNLTGKSEKTRIYLCDLPQMTSYGSFIISGTEKVVITQLTKSPGIYYSTVRNGMSGKIDQQAKIIPDKGTYIEILPKEEQDISIRYDRRLLIPFTSFLRILSFADDGSGTSFFSECSDSELYQVFRNECGSVSDKYISNSIRAEQKLYGEAVMGNAARWFFTRNRQKGDIPEIHTQEIL